MEKEINEISNYRGLVDTSSVVTHDLCAQLHVLQFCVDELSHHVSEEGAEFLNKMIDSTQYIASLVGTFREHLKMTLNDEDSTSLDKIYKAALELVKNHFFIILESVDFKVVGKLERTIVKSEARKVMNIVFSLYSMVLEKMNTRDAFDKENMLIEFKSVKLNNRFAEIQLYFTGFNIDSTWFLEQLEVSTPEKGRLRKYIGQAYIKEKVASNESFLTFLPSDKGSVISFKVPLCSSSV